MGKRPDGLDERDVLFEMQTDKRGLEAVVLVGKKVPGDFRVATHKTACWKEKYQHHPLFLDVEIHKATHNGEDCWLLLKQHDYINYYISEVYVISQKLGLQLIKKHSQPEEVAPFAGHEILITKRPDDFHAYVKDNTVIWGQGSSAMAAVGNMLMTHSEHFGIKISWSEDAQTMKFLEKGR